VVLQYVERLNGEPVILIQDRESAASAGAVKLLFSKLAGREIGEPEIELWGSTRDIATRSEKLPARLLLGLAHVTILDGFVMTPVKMRQYIAVLNRVRPKLIVAYAGAIYELARFAEREGLEVPPQAAVITSAEVLYPFMREQIEKVFQTTLYKTWETSRSLP
jgi:phenylacetate-CoA ligase